MSEVSEQPMDLTEEVEYIVEDAEVIATPIDPTLSNSGEAAEAKAVGDAIAELTEEVADLGDRVSVNGVSAVSGAITVYGTDIPVTDDDGAQTVTEAIQTVTAMDATDIPYDSGNTIAEKINALDAAIVKTNQLSALTWADIE